MKTYDEQRSALQVKLDEKVRSRVLRGLDLLREQYGEDWADHIDLGSLKLSSGEACVLGQLEPMISGNGASFIDACHRIDGELEDSPALFGFDEGDDEDGVFASYSDLQAAWEITVGEAVS